LVAPAGAVGPARPDASEPCPPAPAGVQAPGLDPLRGAADQVEVTAVRHDPHRLVVAGPVPAGPVGPRRSVAGELRPPDPGVEPPGVHAAPAAGEEVEVATVGNQSEGAGVAVARPTCGVRPLGPVFGELLPSLRGHVQAPG